VTDELDLKQKEKDEALQRRKEELEDELDRYARAGAFSPGLIKFTRWLSRGLYLAMAVGFMVMLFSGWGKVSQDEFDRVHEGYTKWKQEAEKEKTAREEAQDALLQAEIKAAKLKIELEGLNEKQDDPEAADAAQERARNLIERAWGEKAYAEHWREKLKTAEPDAHGTEPVAGVRALIKQAAHAASGERLELMRETADFGEAAILVSAKSALDDPDPEVRKVGARLLSRVGQPVDPRLSTDKDEEVLRELWFCYGRQYQGAADTFYAEAFVGMAISVNPTVEKLDQAYRSAPEDKRIELLALLAECTHRDESGLAKMIATSERPLAEKIIAVRWMGESRNESSHALLKTLSEGQGVLADEAKKALN
jgi:hypothetical protein